MALPALLLMFALGMAGRGPAQDLPGTPSESGLGAAQSLFRQAAGIVEANAADPPEQKALLEESLDGMLHGLDPHSNYFGPEAFKDLMEDQEGKFSGLGLLVTKPGVNSPLLVIQPIPDTPAWKAGIRAGDVILEVDGQPTDKMSSREAVRKLKGPDGTKVTIKLGRGDAKPEPMTLKRAPIPKHTVPYAFMLPGGEGYAKVNTFGNTTVEELQTNLDRLKAAGMTSLILDLRDNPGGSMPAAVGMASLFLKKGQEVVSVRGRRSGITLRHRATKDGPFADLPMVVLINLGSASASEIVAGRPPGPRPGRGGGGALLGQGPGADHDPPRGRGRRGHHHGPLLHPLGAPHPAGLQPLLRRLLLPRPAARGGRRPAPRGGRRGVPHRRRAHGLRRRRHRARRAGEGGQDSPAWP